MLLSEAEIRRSEECVEAAFPHFGDWKHVNEIDESYSGFTLWGGFVPKPNGKMPRRFFITFTIYKTKWTGCLSIGQHCYFWSSADVGDAYLLDTVPCANLEDAIMTLKVQIADLFIAFSGKPPNEPEV